MNTVKWLLTAARLDSDPSHRSRPKPHTFCPLHHLLPATCQSPPASVAAPAVWPFAASAYPSPRLGQQNQLVSDSKAEACSPNFWAPFSFPSLCDHKTISTIDPRHLRSSGDIFWRYNNVFVLQINRLPLFVFLWAINTEVFWCLLTTFSGRGHINITNSFCLPSK